MIRKMTEKVLIVGAGITGSVTAALLRKQLPEGRCRVTVWDKAFKTGGRMNTTRGPLERHSSVDLGAQYISVEPTQQLQHESIYRELQDEKVLRPLTGEIIGDKPRPEGTKHYIPHNGMRELVQHFLQQSGAEVELSHTVRELSQEQSGWVVRTEEGEEQTFDSVILTLPVPQILKLQGSMQSILEQDTDQHKKLKEVKYSSRFAMGMFYEPGTKIDVPWCAKYFPGDPMVVFVSIDNKKRGNDPPSKGPSVLVHSSVPFGLKHLKEDADLVCSEYLLSRVLELVPELPLPVATKHLKWRHSQVFKGYTGSPGAVVLHQKPLLVCGGDAFSSNQGFNGCLDSAKVLTATITNKLASIE